MKYCLRTPQEHKREEGKVVRDEKDQADCANPNKEFKEIKGRDKYS